MKPSTLSVFTSLSLEDIKGEAKEIVNAVDLDILDADICREIAANCRNIIDVAEALENLYLTAADELDRISAAAEEAAYPEKEDDK